MKKLIIAAIAITTSVFANAQADTTQAQAAKEIAANNENPDRVKIKLEELPAAVRKVLTDSAYQGWTAKQAYIVKAEKPFYEVELANTTGELRTVKFNEDGTVIN
ncbi:hypothetical protein D3C87_37360 [compost metagenome]